LIVALVRIAASANEPEMLFGDASSGRPFSKDPDVVRWRGKYYMYFSMPPTGQRSGWTIGVAESDDLTTWKTVGEVGGDGDYEEKGRAAPCVVILKGKIHMFYQTYGNGPRDAICHAWSDDGIHFTKDPTNPVFQPTGDWNCGRAIDAEVIEHGGTTFLYWATRDPDMKLQMLGVATADASSNYGRDAWSQACGEPILKPDSDWEQSCIEAASILIHDGLFYMFYAGAYNHELQQIGAAVSRDGLRWSRLSKQPILPVGEAGEWNAGESGHPGVFVDDDGQTYLFFQGKESPKSNYLLSKVKVAWDGPYPYLIRPRDGKEFRLTEPIPIPPAD
jgi:sucrose-6-phosphate hydrolase SacC (GH32 family)